MVSNCHIATIPNGNEDGSEPVSETLAPPLIRPAPPYRPPSPAIGEVQHKLMHIPAGAQFRAVEVAAFGALGL
jgi:hypothetical protein